MEAPTNVRHGVPDGVSAVEPLADGDGHNQSPVVPESPDRGEEIERGCGMLGSCVAFFPWLSFPSRILPLVVTVDG